MAQYACEAILQIGDETGPLPGELGYTALAPNAIVKIRGQSSSYHAQKNYKVSLKKDKGSWRDQTVINLNKHQSDGLRFRNKLAFDLLKSIPQTTSCRTQFVHLYVCDQTWDGTNTVFKDYGLYTHVEAISKTYLKNHDMDRYGQLYKVEYFEFYRYPEAIKLKTDPTYDEAAFNEILEIKGNDDHAKLIAMLDAVNDYATPIEDVLAKWFDIDNLVYWFAFHMLMGNYDVQSRNAFLYSPKSIERFFVLSWDNDGSLFHTEHELSGTPEDVTWQDGVSNHWGQVLFNRALKTPEFRMALDAAVEDLMSTVFAGDGMEKMVERYRRVTEPFVLSQPDMLNDRLTQETYDLVARALPGEVQQNYERYHASLEKPMPFYIGVPMAADGVLTMEWDASYDFDGEVITYHAILARDASFDDVLLDDTMKVPQTSLNDPGEGQYFLSVEATNESGFTQTAFDVCRVNSQKVYGAICFYILADGSVVLDGNGGVRDEGADKAAGAAEAEGTIEVEGVVEPDMAKDIDEATEAEGTANADEPAETDDVRAAAESSATKAGEKR